MFSKASSSASLNGTSKRDKSSKEGKRRSSRKSDHESSSNVKAATPSSQWYTTPECELSPPIISSVATTTVFELRQEVSVKYKISNSKYRQKNGKAIPVRFRGGAKGCETLRFPHFLDSQQADGGEVVSLTRQLPFYSQQDSWYSFLFEAESTPVP
jgi:hypothetical protein